MWIKFVLGNLVGMVIVYYLFFDIVCYDEMDFEFFGNVLGQFYILQMNIYVGGKGQWEQRIYFWFDFLVDFYEYFVLWNRKQIVFYVDDIFIWMFKNNKVVFGQDYLDFQVVGIYSSIWNGENWVINDGWVKFNWIYVFFIVIYEKFNVDVCFVL